MATTLDAINTNTLLDLAVEMGPDGELMKMAMVLAQTNEMLLDAQWFEANGTTYHKFVQSLDLPAGAFRMINKGTPLDAAHGTPGTEALAMLQSISRIDTKLVDIAPNSAEFRNNKALMTLEGMNQTLSGKLVYGNEVGSPEEITGFAPRLNDLGLTNVVSMGSTSASGDLTSIYFIDWGESKVFLAYPKDASELGITHKDNGIHTVADSESPAGYYEIYEDIFKADIGLVVEDPRCIARLCNIETATGVSDVLAIDGKIMGLLNRMPGRGSGVVMYCNTTILTAFDVLGYAKTSPITYGEDGDVFGRPTTFFRKRPLRLVEQILDTEALVA